MPGIDRSRSLSSLLGAGGEVGPMDAMHARLACAAASCLVYDMRRGRVVTRVICMGRGWG